MLTATFVRPDVITRTGVIQPFAMGPGHGPVMAAQSTVNPFVAAVRPDGPAVVTPPTPQEIAAAAAAVAREFAQSRGAKVKLGPAVTTVKPGQKAPPGIVGAVVETAKALARGQAVMVKVGPQAALVRPAEGWTGLSRAAQVGVATRILARR